MLFIDARKMGAMISRTQRELTDADIQKIADTYHAWRGDQTLAPAEPYEDIKGYCKSATVEEIAEHNYVLTPGRYVGIEEVDVSDEEPFEEKMERLTDILAGQFEEAGRLEERIRENLRGVGYGI